MGKSGDAYAQRQEARPQHLSAEPLPKFNTKSSEPFRAVNVWKRAKQEVVLLNNKAKWHLHAKEIDIKRWRNTKGW